jgi:hypothetical protein
MVRVDRARPDGISRLATGVTHTQHSLDPWGDAEAVARGKALVRSVARYQNQHLMGWGAMNPNPAPGVYDWESLDRRVEMMRSLGGTPVITLCAAPDWMKGGKPGETDWSKIEVAPRPEHYADFAKLAARVARRYPHVKQFQVWNEMKGFWKASINNWDYEGYTRLYNLVYDALKAVNRDIWVGGPYLVIEGTGSNKGGWAAEPPIRERQWEVLNYWLKHKRGADFIVLDKGIQDYHDRHEYTDAELMALTPFFGDVARQIRAKTVLPIWWAEYYGGTRSPEFVAAHYASILRHMLLAGSAVALLWSPQASDVDHGLFTDTRKPGGGQPLPHHRVLKLFHDHFGPGTPLYRATSSSPEVEVLSSAKKTLLINKRPDPVRVDLDGRSLTLERYEVRALGASQPP